MTHSFNVEIAKEYGVGCAIILQNIYFWVEKNKANDKHFYNGSYWTYNSKKAFLELFPYFTEKQIRIYLDKLKSEGLVNTENFNTLPFDRTLWYSLTTKAYALFNKGLTHLPYRANGLAVEGQPIPDNKPDNKPDINKNIIKSNISFFDFMDKGV